MKKAWTTAIADKKFSIAIRDRDKQCVLCKREYPEVILTCSHYWGRYASSTRYDFENCDALCYRCHFEVENAKQGKYKDFKEKQLGKKKYDALRKKYYQNKMTRKDAIKELQKKLSP